MKIIESDHLIPREDLITIADAISLTKADEIIDGVAAAVEQWPVFAKEAGIKAEVIEDIRENHRIL